MNFARAIEVFGIAEHAWPELSPTMLHSLYREISKSAHPDAGGDPEHWLEVQEAREYLTDALHRIPCPECDGTGIVQYGRGFAPLPTTCQRCLGSKKKWGK